VPERERGRGRLTTPHWTEREAKTGRKKRNCETKHVIERTTKRGEKKKKLDQNPERETSGNIRDGAN